jgi:DNA topoisomerase-1
MKNLIIVESPAKAKTIGNFLGREYKVVASKGHIRDLPKNSFGITIDEDGKFIPKYSISRDVNPIVRELKKFAKEAETIYIATDEDREGEAIGYHIAKAIGKEPETLPRIVFHEITKSAIDRALQNPRTINMRSVDAQQTRRLLDRIVGYKLSPLLAVKIQKGLSAGRVQSSALKIVVDKEREIQAFKTQEYWSIRATFDGTLEADIYTFLGDRLEKLSIKSEKEASKVVEEMKRDSFKITSIETSKRKGKTPPPFMTSTLQQSASNQLGFSPKKTMLIAQKLYEGVKTQNSEMGIITYMRTDSLNLSTEAVDSAREYIEKRFGVEYLPKKPKKYSRKSKSAQEAHEAIRPTVIDFTPEVAKNFLSNDEYKLYKLIYERFITSQMSDAQFETETVLIEGEKGSFKATGRRLLFDGFYKMIGYNEKDRTLPTFKVEQSVKLTEIESRQHFTEPPNRYSEATLIKKLESLGIGRPSTYAPTITILQNREYIEIEKKKIIPTKIAFTVIELLEKYFSEIVDTHFTSNMEETLDLIADGKSDWQKVLRSFYEPFIKKVKDGKRNIPSLKSVKPTGEKCPKCGEELVIRSGRYGEFIACSGYPKCKYSANLDDKDGETNSIDEVCEKCGSAMIIKVSKRGKFIACSAYPKCKNTKPLHPPKELETPCPECGAKIVEREGRRGQFYGCSNYPKCRFIANFKPIDKKCSECGYLMCERVHRNREVIECLRCKHKESKS